MSARLRITITGPGSAEDLRRLVDAFSPLWDAIAAASDSPETSLSIAVDEIPAPELEEAKPS